MSSTQPSPQNKVGIHTAPKPSDRPTNTDAPLPARAPVDQTPTDQEAVELTAQLVHIDSSDPGAYEAQIEKYVHDWLVSRAAELGFDLCAASCPVSVDELEALPGRRCLRARIQGTDEAPEFVLLSHLDTVTLGDGWSEDTPALGAVIRNGLLYGRGACDMKGGMACAMLAFRDALRQLARTGRQPRRSFSLICTCDEEDFMRGSEAAIRAGWLDGSQWILDTEPTDGLLRMAHKGRVWFELTMRGVTAHASTPWKGADAIAAMAETICSIRREVAALPIDDELGSTTVTFGQITGGYRPYVVPDSCIVWIDMRLAPPTTPDDAIAIVRKGIAAAESAVAGTKGQFKVTGDRPAIPSHPDSGLVAAVWEATRDVCGKPAEMATFTGYTDSAVVAGICHNPNCASYGPGSLEVAHKPNEFVPLADLARVHAVYRHLATA
ncbi:MAG: M20 family metallopeptidase [Atopobiaceae bacterium]